MRSCPGPNAKFFSWQLKHSYYQIFILSVLLCFCARTSIFCVIDNFFWVDENVIFSGKHQLYNFITLILLHLVEMMALESWLLYSDFGFFGFLCLNFFGFLILDEISFSSVQRPCFAITKTYQEDQNTSNTSGQTADECKTGIQDGFILIQITFIQLYGSENFWNHKDGNYFEHCGKRDSEIWLICVFFFWLAVLHSFETYESNEYGAQGHPITKGGR